MPIVAAATPLIALDAVAIDCETTGLDASKARLIEVAAITLASGKIVAEPLFASLVDPGVPIPETGWAVHGIGDADIVGAPTAGRALELFTAVIGERVVIGHSVGFDLAIIDAERRRVGLEPWLPSAVLDLRLLAEIAAPRLASYSLDALGSWLGVEIEGRHRAIGDARTTAAIFLALAPRLREAGIRTLAEAEAACRDRVATLDAQHRAGWREPVVPAAQREAERRLGRIDAFAYRHRVAEVMASPPIVVTPETPLAEALARFAEAGIGSVYVRTGDAYGIVTERDILRAIHRHGSAALGLAAGEIMRAPLVTVPAEAFVYRAIGRMDRMKVRHLGVADEAGRLVGALSMRDLMHLRAQAAVNLGDAIEEAADEAALARAWATLPAVAGAMVEEDLAGTAIAAVISSELGELTARAARLAEARLLADGMGPPPRPYAVLVLGSAGRAESLLAMDQDNGLVFADDGAGDEAVDDWFAALGERLCETLHAVGVPLCKGGVMARNAPWRGSLATWRGRVDDWLRRSRPEDLLNVDIFFDLRPVHGDVSLAGALREHAFEAAQPATAFIKLLAEAGAAGGSPFGLFGRIREEEGRVDLKRAGLFRAVTAARCLAIRHGVRRHGTGERLAELAALGIGAEADLRRFAEAHGTLLDCILRQQLADVAVGIPPSNRVALATLDKAARGRLKEALAALESAPEVVRGLLFAKSP